jgi:hypothetical protein
LKTANLSGSSGTPKPEITDSFSLTRARIAAKMDCFLCAPERLWTIEKNHAQQSATHKAGVSLAAAAFPMSSPVSGSYGE